MSLAAVVNSCFSSKAFSNERSRCLVISGLVAVASLCLVTALLGQFQVYSGLSLAGRIALFTSAGIVSLIAMRLICVKPHKDDPMKTYLATLGFPNATVQKTKQPSDLIEGYEDTFFIVFLDGKNDKVTFRSSNQIGAKPNPESAQYNFRKAYFEKKLEIDHFLKDIDDFEISSSQTDWQKTVMNMANQFIHEKISQGIYINISSFECNNRDLSKLHFSFSDRISENHYAYLISLQLKGVVKDLLLAICEERYQFTNQRENVSSPQ